MIKKKSFKTNDEYFKFIDNNETIKILELKLIEGKYILRYENLSEPIKIPETDNEVEWPSIKKRENISKKTKGGNKNDRRRNKKDLPNEISKKIIRD